EKRPHLVPAVVEDQRAPVLMFSLARIGMFVERRAVELGEAVAIFREMAGNPVQNHAQPVTMTLIDEIAEIVRRAEPAGWRKKADHLIPPRAGKRMLHHRHQLD